MGSPREVQHRVAVEGTPVLARVARDAGVGDVAEDGALLPEGNGDYPDTKKATDAAPARVGGFTTVLVRPPAILGAGETSPCNTLRPQEVRGGKRRSNPAQT